MVDDLPLEALIPPAKPGIYTFFRDGARYPFEPKDARFNLRTAWWLADTAYLAYSSEADIRDAYRRAGVNVQITPVGDMYLPWRLSTQCYVAVADDWIVLAIRGTQLDRFFDFVSDWAINLRVIPMRDGANLVHGGFIAALNQVWGKVLGIIRAAQQQRRRPLWLTGHSLGAALATVALARCATEPDQLGVKGLYTFGSPRVGDRTFGASLPAPAYRFRNNLDAVSHVPLPPPYRHVGQLYFIDGDGRLHLNPTTLEEGMLEAKIEAKRLLARILRADLRGKIPAVLADHAPINYARLISAAFLRSTV